MLNTDPNLGSSAKEKDGFLLATHNIVVVNREYLKKETRLNNDICIVRLIGVCKLLMTRDALAPSR